MPQPLAHIALIVRDYDEAIAWFTEKLGFTLVADQYQPEQDKRWVLVAPPGAGDNRYLRLPSRRARARRHRADVAEMSRKLSERRGAISLPAAG